MDVPTFLPHEVRVFKYMFFALIFYISWVIMTNLVPLSRLWAWTKSVLATLEIDSTLTTGGIPGTFPVDNERSEIDEVKASVTDLQDRMTTTESNLHIVMEHLETQLSNNVSNNRHQTRLLDQKDREIMKERSQSIKLSNELDRVTEEFKESKSKGHDLEQELRHVKGDVEYLSRRNARIETEKAQLQTYLEETITKLNTTQNTTTELCPELIEFVLQHQNQDCIPKVEVDQMKTEAYQMRDEFHNFYNQHQDCIPKHDCVCNYINIQEHQDCVSKEEATRLLREHENVQIGLAAQRAYNAENERTIKEGKEYVDRLNLEIRKGQDHLREQNAKHAKAMVALMAKNEELTQQNSSLQRLAEQLPKTRSDQAAMNTLQASLQHERLERAKAQSRFDENLKNLNEARREVEKLQKQQSSVPTPSAVTAPMARGGMVTVTVLANKLAQQERELKERHARRVEELVAKCRCG